MKYQRDHQKLVEICSTASTYSEVETRYGVTTPNTGLRRYLKQNDIPMPLYQGQSAGNRLSQKSRANRISDSDLCENSRAATGAVKKYIIRMGYKKEQCEKCGWCERRSDELCPVHLHHRNGDDSDNRIENIEILCPNCHSLTENYAGKNKTKGNPGRRARHQARAEYFSEPRHVCSICGKLGYGKKYCSRECYHQDQRRVERPTEEQLKADLASLSWTAVGKKYGVSDNAVRKWAKSLVF